MNTEYSFDAMRNAMQQFLDHLLVDPNVEQLSECLSENFTCESKIVNKEGKEELSRDKKGEFINFLVIGHFNNIAKNDDGKYLIQDNEFSYAQEKSNELISTVKTRQYRYGNGALENGPGWYELTSKIFTTFTNENERLRILTFKQYPYNKIKI